MAMRIVALVVVVMFSRMPSVSGEQQSAGASANGPKNVVAGGQPPASANSDANADNNSKKVNVRFDHRAGTAQISTLDLSNGDRFTVAIDNTCPDAFDYSYVGLQRAINQPQSASNLKPLETKYIDIVYDQRFGGYIFSISKKPGVNAADLCQDGDKLGPASFVINVRQQTWNVAFSGGFTISGLTNPVFSVKSVNGTKTIIREQDKEDVAKLGAASFVSVFHDRAPWASLSFGLGINNDNRAEYLVGFGLRLNDKATINVGEAWGSVARLPNGIALNDPATDDNVLNNLGTRVISRWFVALSYSFIDTKDRLLKPFAEDSTAGGSAASSGATPAENGLSDAVLTDVKAAAGSKDTFNTGQTVKSALTSLEVCGADATKNGSKADVTIHIKTATSEQLTLLNGSTATAEASVAITAALKKKNEQVPIGTVTFDSGKCPSQ